jgi:hypothetical protein
MYHCCEAKGSAERANESSDVAEYALEVQENESNESDCK